METKRKLIEVEAIFGPLLAFPDDLITEQIVKFGAHTRPELAMLLRIIAPGDSVFDLGAHIGTFTIPMARKAGVAGRVLAVEALPRTFRVLQRNLRRNNVDGSVEGINALIAPTELHYAPVRQRGNTGGTRFEATDKGGTNVERISIDALCDRYFKPRVVKVDIEGFEVIVLTASRAIPEIRPILYAEVSARNFRNMGSTIAELDGLLRGWGYRLFRNVAPRNASSDLFEVRELAALSGGGDFFDVLAIHAADERLGWLVGSPLPA